MFTSDGVKQPQIILGTNKWGVVILIYTWNLAEGPRATLAIQRYKSRFRLDSNKMHLLQFFISAISLTTNSEPSFLRCIFESDLECGINVFISSIKWRSREARPRHPNIRTLCLLIHLDFQIKKDKFTKRTGNNAVF